MIEKPNLIAIAGGSCSGKTTLTRALVAHYGDDKAVHVSFDDYFIGNAHLPPGFVTDWENPYVFDLVQFRRDVEALARGEAIIVQNRALEHLHAQEVFRRVEPRKLVFVEGFLVLRSPTLRRLYASSFFVDVSEEEMVRRRMVRAQEPGNWDTEEYIQTKLIPGYLRYVKPQRRFAQHVLDGEVPIDELVADMRKYL